MFSLNNQEILEFTANICANELTVNKSHISSEICHFQNLHILVLHQKFYTNVYDLRNVFIFPFANFPFSNR